MGARRALAALAGVAALVVATAPAAGAQQDRDPYGPTTTTAGAVADEPVRCELGAERAAVGSEVMAEVHHVRVGRTARVFVAGSVVGTGTASTEDGAPTATVRVLFELPEVEPGPYEVTAVGNAFTVRCGVGDGGPGVLAATVGPGSGGSGWGLLAIVTVLALVVLTAALVVRGRMRAARRIDDWPPPEGP